MTVFGIVYLVLWLFAAFSWGAYGALQNPNPPGPYGRVFGWLILAILAIIGLLLFTHLRL